MSTWRDLICENTFETSHDHFIHEKFSVLITTPLDQIHQNLFRDLLNHGQSCGHRFGDVIWRIPNPTLTHAFDRADRTTERVIFRNWSFRVRRDLFYEFILPVTINVSKHIFPAAQSFRCLYSTFGDLSSFCNSCLMMEQTRSRKYGLLSGKRQYLPLRSHVSEAASI